MIRPFVKKVRDWRIRRQVDKCCPSLAAALTALGKGGK